MAAEEFLSNQKMVEKPTIESRTKATMRTVSEIGFQSSPAFCLGPPIEKTKVAHSKKEQFASATKQKQIKHNSLCNDNIRLQCVLQTFLLISRQSKPKKLSKLKGFLLKFKDVKFKDCHF